MPLPQPRKEIVDPLQRPFSGPGGGHEVFVHREIRETAAAFRHKAEPKPGDTMRRHTFGRLAVEQDAACLWRQEIADGLDRRGFTHAVAAHQGNDFAFGDLELDAEKRLAAAVIGGDVLNIEQHQA